MLESDVLARAFHEFDREEKVRARVRVRVLVRVRALTLTLALTPTLTLAQGYITEADLQRVLSQKLGAGTRADGDAAAILHGAASVLRGDVDGRRVMYGSFVLTLALTLTLILTLTKARHVR